MSSPEPPKEVNPVADSRVGTRATEVAALRAAFEEILSETGLTSAEFEARLLRIPRRLVAVLMMSAEPPERGGD